MDHFPIVVVVGARQVGKSTLLQHEYGEIADYVVFDPVVDTENANQDPELFLSNHKTPFILDEIQYAPSVVAALKRRVDKNKTPGQYLLTGSQQWGILKSMEESLAGRAVFLDLEGFSISEILEKTNQKSWLERFFENPDEVPNVTRHPLPFSLSEQLYRGFFPEAQNIPLNMIPDFYEGYLRTYLERDIRMLTDVHDLFTFSRFVRLSAALSAQEINMSQLGRELGLTPQTSKRWISLLESTFQWTSIPAFSGNMIKQVSGKNKGYWTDTGLLCHTQAISSPEALAGHPLWGPIFETAVVSEIKKTTHGFSAPPQMYHWRRYAGAEVDLILERDGIFYPIEIKASTRIGKSDAKGIMAFREHYPNLKIAKGVILAPVEKSFPVTERDFVMPWDGI